MKDTIENAPKVLKESKNSIKVDFERTSKWTRFRIKYLSINFVVSLVYKLFRFILLLGVSYVIIFPFISKIAGSFMSPDDFVDVTVKLIPKYPTLDQYKYIILENDFFPAMLNTFLLSLMCAVIQTFVTCLVGYGFAKFKFRGNKILFFAVIFSMVVPHQIIRLSMFYNFRYFDILGITNLLGGGVSENFNVLGFLTKIKALKPFFKGTFWNLLDSNWPLILLSIGGLGFKNGLYVFIMRQYFKGVPDELEESAYIDGSGVFSTFFRIIIPISIPMMLTVFLFAFSWQWTDNFYSDLFYVGTKITLLPDIVKIPKSLVTSFAGQNLYYQAIRNTAALLIMIPLIILYLFFQKSLVQGIERSGIVG